MNYCDRQLIEEISGKFNRKGNESVDDLYRYLVPILFTGLSLIPSLLSVLFIKALVARRLSDGTDPQRDSVGHRTHLVPHQVTHLSAVSQPGHNRCHQQSHCRHRTRPQLIPSPTFRSRCS